MRNGHELRVTPFRDSYNPTFVKDGKVAGYASMRTVSSLLDKKFIKHSEKYDKSFHYYLLTEEGINISL